MALPPVKSRLKHLTFADKERVFNIFNTHAMSNPEMTNADNVVFTSKAAGNKEKKLHQTDSYVNDECDMLAELNNSEIFEAIVEKEAATVWEFLTTKSLGYVKDDPVMDEQSSFNKTAEVNCEEIQHIKTEEVIIKDEPDEHMDILLSKSSNSIKGMKSSLSTVMEKCVKDKDDTEDQDEIMIPIKAPEQLTSNKIEIPNQLTDPACESASNSTPNNNQTNLVYNVPKESTQSNQSTKKTPTLFQKPKTLGMPSVFLDKRFCKGKDALEARKLHNYISQTTIVQAPLRQERQPRKQKINPVARADDTIVVQAIKPLDVSSDSEEETDTVNQVVLLNPYPGGKLVQSHNQPPSQPTTPNDNSSNMEFHEEGSLMQATLAETIDNSVSSLSKDLQYHEEGSLIQETSSKPNDNSVNLSKDMQFHEGGSLMQATPSKPNNNSISSLSEDMQFHEQASLSKEINDNFKHNVDGVSMDIQFHEEGTLMLETPSKPNDNIVSSLSKDMQFHEEGSLMQETPSKPNDNSVNLSKDMQFHEGGSLMQATPSKPNDNCVSSLNKDMQFHEQASLSIAINDNLKNSVDDVSIDMQFHNQASLMKTTPSQQLKPNDNLKHIVGGLSKDMQFGDLMKGPQSQLPKPNDNLKHGIGGLSMQFHKEANISKAAPSQLLKPKDSFKHKCDICGDVFKNTILLKRHLDLHKISKFDCTICKRIFSDKSQLATHKRSHVLEKMFKTMTADIISPKKQEELLKRPALMQNRLETFKCTVCSQIYSSTLLLNIHSKTHIRLSCPNCPATFKSRLLLDDHRMHNCVKSPTNKKRISFIPPKKTQMFNKRQSIQPKPKPKTPVPSTLQVACDNCDAILPSYKNLLEHKVNVHGYHTPDKSVGKTTNRKSLYKPCGAHSGVPASHKMRKVFAAFRMKLEDSQKNS